MIRAAEGRSRFPAPMPWETEPRRPWSLGEMLKHYGWAAADCIEGCVNLIRAFEEEGRRYGEDSPIDPSRYPDGHALMQQIASIRSFGDHFGMKMVEAQIIRLETLFDVSGSTYGDAVCELKKLQERVQDSLAEYKFYWIENRLLPYFEQPTPLWGAAVETAFQSAAIGEDIVEAGKCLAFGRSTACVFHLMRVLDSVIEQLCTLAKTKAVKNPNWGDKLNAIRDVVNQIPGSDPRKEAWEEAKLLLIAVKNAWRNPTIHPKKTYTEAEAMDVFNAVRQFADSLARLPPL